MASKFGRAIYVVMGRPASGKTTVAHALSKNEGLMYLSSSVAKENLPKKHTLRSCFDESFRDESYAAIIKAAVHNLEIGISSVLDASFYKKESRSPLYEAVKDKATAIIIIYCFCNEETETAKRIKNRQLNPDFAHNRACTMDTYEYINVGFEEPGFNEFPRDVPITLIYLETYTGATNAKTWLNKATDTKKGHREAVLTVLDAVSTVTEKQSIND